MKKSSAKIGEVKAVVNEQRAFGSANEYEMAWMKRNGRILPFAFTKSELDEAAKRADRNQEDVPNLKKNFLSHLF